jgi:hypothetical protein
LRRLQAACGEKSAKADARSPESKLAPEFVFFVIDPLSLYFLLLGSNFIIGHLAAEHVNKGLNGVT